jgi:hypothetical protein
MNLYFVIDTDTYAGNFERELCAYITGVVGECGVGQGIADKLDGNSAVEKIETYIGTEPDEHGCWRPCKIYPTPGWLNNGFGFEFRNGNEELAKKEYVTSCIEQAQSELRMYAHMPEYAQARFNEWMNQANDPDSMRSYPAYMSVAIVLDEEPPDEIIARMKERAKEFADIARTGDTKQIGARMNVGGFNITGFRLVREKTVTTETQYDLGD